VIATSNDPTQAKAALELAGVTYDAIVRRYGLKDEQYQKKDERHTNERGDPNVRHPWHSGASRRGKVRSVLELSPA
jgi:hypothetical protein